MYNKFIDILKKFLGIMRKFLDGLSDCFGRAVASYNLYLQRANAKAREQAQSNTKANFTATWQGIFAWLLWSAINTTAPLTGLLVPVSPANLLVNNPCRILKGGIYILIFEGWSKPGSNVPVRQIQYQLNVELRLLCLLNGIPLVQAVKVIRGAHCRVRFILVFANQIHAANNSSSTGSSSTGSSSTGSPPTGSSPTGSSPTGSSPTGSSPTGSP